MKIRVIVIFLLVVSASSLLGQIRVGSKNFSESRLLAEILAQAIERETDLTVERKMNLGGTMICFEALKTGQIDLYPEYTGTGWTAILKETSIPRGDSLTTELLNPRFESAFGLRWAPPFGFNNTYAIAIHTKFPFEKLSELSNTSVQLRGGLTHEFMNRPDGYRALSQHYRFPSFDTRGMEHALAYQSISAGQIDFTDAYTTDGSLLSYDLKLLEDDQHFFPPYEGAPLYSVFLIKKYPEVQGVLSQLENRLNDSLMQALNYQVEVSKQPLATVANQFLDRIFLKHDTTLSEPKSNVKRVLEKTWEHLVLVLLSVLFSTLIALGLSFLFFDRKRIAAVMLQIVNIIQTIPSLALLGLLIPLAGIGFLPAFMALCVYGLLPIVRNTLTGLQEISHDVTQSAEALGMTRNQILWHVRLPLAIPVILSGIRTSLVISVGTATVAAFIGAGGLGEFIVTGITLNDEREILLGALPAAGMALLLDSIFAIFHPKRKSGK